LNWLAHVLLSEPDVEFRLGSLLADIVKGPDRVGMRPLFLAGMQQHQVIDAFTDTDEIVRRSRGRVGMPGEYRLVRGIVIDVFYDHLLALDWDRYSAQPLDEFTARFYADVKAHPFPLPTAAQVAVDRMLEHDALGSYRTLEGVEGALRRVSVRLQARTGKEFHLDRALPELVAHLEELRADFAEFFPGLRAHLAQRSTNSSRP
jgi:acyl carrier protein phosphodiesterase